MDQAFWDARYADEQYAYGTEPNAFLVEQQHHLDACMRALVPGDGEGRNSVWLAQQGMDVTAVDFSRHGLNKAQALAKSRGVKITTEQADLTVWQWPEDSFELLVSIALHFLPEYRQTMHQAMHRALVPGGILMLEAFHPDQLKYQTGGPPREDMLYTLDMLHEDFPDAEILHEEETVTNLDEGQYHWGYAALTRIVLSKRE
jgi:2-polyprenyl-3-methyl-5-hydroxy-6-metoxy-1,4-benzoquinol methylase